MKIDSNKDQEKSFKLQSIQEGIFLFVDKVFFKGFQLSFFLNKLHLSSPEGRTL